MGQTTKQKVLSLLFAKDGYLSGEEIAGQLSVSRTAVWKAISALKEDGYRLEAVSNRGYRLISCPDLLDKGQIAARIDGSFWESITVLPEVDSTNLYIKRLAAGGKRGCYAVTAECQTTGRGRMNREFVSPKGSGIYLSLAYDIPVSVTDSGLITVFTSVAVADAIKEVLGVECGIKWVNDLFVGDKKVCGVLTEGTMDFESGNFDYFIVGIGINVTSPEGGFKGVSKGVAGAVCDGLAPEEIPQLLRCKLIAAVMNRMQHIGEMLSDRGYLKEYRERSIVLGKRVTVYRTMAGSGESYEAIAVGIDDDGHLLVEDDTGAEHTLYSGEVSVKLQGGK